MRKEGQGRGTKRGVRTLLPTKCDAQIRGGLEPRKRTGSAKRISVVAHRESKRAVPIADTSHQVQRGRRRAQSYGKRMKAAHVVQVQPGVHPVGAASGRGRSARGAQSALRKQHRAWISGGGSGQPLAITTSAMSQSAKVMGAGVGRGGFASTRRSSRRFMRSWGGAPVGVRPRRRIRHLCKWGSLGGEPNFPTRSSGGSDFSAGISHSRYAFLPSRYAWCSFLSFFFWS